MTTLNIQIKNGDKLIRAFREAPDLMAKELQSSIKKVGLFTVGEVKKIITSGTGMWKPPIKTGALRRGIQIRQTNKLRVIITPADITPYALYVHEGTWKMQARPFFKITAKRKNREIEAFFNVVLDNIVKKIINKTK